MEEASAQVSIRCACDSYAIGAWSGDGEVLSTILRVPLFEYGVLVETVHTHSACSQPVWTLRNGARPVPPRKVDPKLRYPLFSLPILFK